MVECYVMTKIEAIALIDNRNNALAKTANMLNYTILRLIIKQIPDDKWEEYVINAIENLG